MLLVEVFAFWLLVGVAFFGWRSLANRKEFRVPRVVPPIRGATRVAMMNMEKAEPIGSALVESAHHDEARRIC